MLRASLKKIKSAPNTILLWVGIGLFVVAMTFWVAAFVMVRSLDDNNATVSAKDYKLQTYQRAYTLEEAKTADEQQKGLGGRASLMQNKGMIFTFADTAERCFWMKNMFFPIDIIWAGQNKKVTYIEKNISPVTYPKTFCHDAKYVIELNAGHADINSLQVGQQLNF